MNSKKRTRQLIIRPYRPYYVRRCGLLLPTVRGLSVDRSVTLVRHAKTAEPIEMPFGFRTRVGPGNHVLDGDPDHPMGRGNFEGGWASRCKARDTLRSPVQKQLNRSWCHL